MFTVRNGGRQHETGSESLWDEFSTSHSLTPSLVAERAFDKDPSLYLLSLKQMIENDYPIWSNMGDVCDKPDGWVEILQLVSQYILFLPHERQHEGVFTIDCEMVRRHFSSTSLAQPDSV